MEIAVEIAMALFGAESALLRAESDLERVLYNLFGPRPVDWTSYEYDRRERRLDVYGVLDSQPACEALARAGFSKIVLHDHPVEEFTMCACKAHTPGRMR